MRQLDSLAADQGAGQPGSKKRMLKSRTVDYRKGTLEVRQLDSGAAGELGDWTARKLEGEAAGEWDSNSRVG